MARFPSLRSRDCDWLKKFFLNFRLWNQDSLLNIVTKSTLVWQDISPVFLQIYVRCLNVVLNISIPCCKRLVHSCSECWLGDQNHAECWYPRNIISSESCAIKSSSCSIPLELPFLNINFKKTWCRWPGAIATYK